jgi:hypothetical protein
MTRQQKADPAEVMKAWRSSYYVCNGAKPEMPTYKSGWVTFRTPYSHGYSHKCRLSHMEMLTANLDARVRERMLK